VALFGVAINDDNSAVTSSPGIAPINHTLSSVVSAHCPLVNPLTARAVFNAFAPLCSDAPHTLQAPAHSISAYIPVIALLAVVVLFM
jgi:hypothetical protein